MRSLPFARLNLRRNPFGEPPQEDRSVLLVGGLEDWPAFLRGLPRGRIPQDAAAHEVSGSRPYLQLLGPSGCGKSTLFFALSECFPGSPLVAWCPVRGWPGIPKPGAGPLLVDDAQMMGKRMLAKALRFPAVAVATQVDLGAAFRKAGFRVRTVRVQDRVGSDRLGEVVQRRLEWARRTSGPVPDVDEGLRKTLLERHGHDLRSMLAHLYDRFQQLEAQE